MIFQPSGNFRNTRVNHPCGVFPSDMVKCHAPRTNAASGARASIDLQIGEFQLAHLAAFALVSLAITLEGGLPSRIDFGAGEKRRSEERRVGKECRSRVGR